MSLFKPGTESPVLHADEGLEHEDYEEDEEMEEEDEEYNLKMFGISQALPVEAADIDWDREPETAEEYLLRVRYEAMRCPKVVRVEPDAEKLAKAASSTQGKQHSYIKQMEVAEALDTAPRWAVPENKWVLEFLMDFQQLRETLTKLRQEHMQELAAVQLPDASNRKAWDTIMWGSQKKPAEFSLSDQKTDNSSSRYQATPADCSTSQHSSEVPADASKQTSAASQDGSDVVGVSGASARMSQAADAIHAWSTRGMDHISGPLLRLVLSLDQVSVTTLLHRLIEKTCGLSELTHQFSQWVFALSAVLEKPLHADMSAAFRSLLRVCSSKRAHLSAPRDTELPYLNTLITLSGGYFGQCEHLVQLASDLELN